MKTSIAVLSLFLLVSCQKKSDTNYEKLNKMSWLKGRWEQKLPEGLLVENWKSENDSTFSGETYFIISKDTLHYEDLKLVQKEDKLIYVATVKGQNNDQPVEFKLTSDNDKTFDFENPTHDYPQKITYTQVNASQIKATISGKQQGKSSQESFIMSRK
ncbi:MAG: hypothetical protein RL427_932 [Bacteroidota bacterium]|jgi:hypothetical protein